MAAMCSDLLDLFPSREETPLFVLYAVEDLEEARAACRSEFQAADVYECSDKIKKMWENERAAVRNLQAVKKRLAQKNAEDLKKLHSEKHSKAFLVDLCKDYEQSHKKLGAGRWQREEAERKAAEAERKAADRDAKTKAMQALLKERKEARGVKRKASEQLGGARKRRRQKLLQVDIIDLT